MIRIRSTVNAGNAVKVKVLAGFYIHETRIQRKYQKMRTKKFHPKLCHIVRNLTLTHIITLIAVSVCILRHFFIETMTTTLVVYKTRFVIHDAESTLNTKNAIIFSSLRSENIIAFFAFKLNSTS